MLFSGIANAAVARLSTGAERRDKRTAAIISAAIRTTAAAITQPRPFFSRTTGAVPFRACRNFCGISGLPSSSDRKSTRLNSSHITISYAVFCLKKKKLELTANYNAALIFFHHPTTTDIYTLSLHDALPISPRQEDGGDNQRGN